MTREPKHKGSYRMVIGGKSTDAGSTFWEAYQAADRARDDGAAKVEVFVQGLGHGPVFVLTPRPDERREQDRIRNTVDPGLWADVLDRVLSKDGENGNH